MSPLHIVVSILFVLFLIYTLIYILQWLFGLYIASNRLATGADRKELISKLYTKEELKKHPLSVLIPAYNEEACIVDTIQSLCKQDYPNLTIIVVDDGSSDATSKRVIEQFHMQQTNETIPSIIKTQPVKRVYKKCLGNETLYLIEKENGGKSDALNCGINACRSEQCVVLDADTQVVQDSLTILMAQFITNPKTVICAGSVSSDYAFYKQSSFFHKILVYFQMLEYYRTFYMQRILLDRINGNIVVSGAFAMFDTTVLKAIGGYKNDTIGEDMEVAMRIHSFCASQHRDYDISYTPEAKCYTQFPFRYKDYMKQRRRWHIGMIQSLKSHRYMCGNYHYGWIGVLSGTMYMLYELYTPFIELLGFATLFVAYYLNILDLHFALFAILLYLIFMVLTQAVLIYLIHSFRLEKITLFHRLQLLVISILEFIIFHPLNMVVKIMAFVTFHHHKEHWGKIKRASGSMLQD